MTQNNDKTSVAWLAPAIGTAASLISGIGADQRQANQQKNLMDIQIQGGKEMADYSQQKQMEMWNATNYAAQMEQLKKAGLNPALLYAKGGAGGTTGAGAAPMPTGGVAANSAATQQAATGMGMMLAQQGLIQAQTEKTKVETAKMAGADTKAVEAGTANTEWQTKLSKAIGEHVIEQAKQQAIKTGVEADWLNAKWRAFEEVQGDTRSEGHKSYNKALKAEWDKTITEAENAKTSGDILKAQKAIEEFKADMAESGLSPESPWYIKLLSEMATRLGINPMN